ncbi:hypothetical protein J437_LFUL019085 [Ladona fulva]|uniref:Uncharacterized protein n=1 Tax=Ladona fulva TaxID=123851 RepID=A0A8K0KR59_LADFU|nr:hypothetical protein J437_LFUL019085 [Ladona fulva]
MISQVYQGIGLNTQLLRLPAMRSFQLPKNIQLSVPQKVTVVSMTVGLALLGFLARYFRRKRHGVGPPANEEETNGTDRGTAKGKGRDSCRASGGRGSVFKSRSPNGACSAFHQFRAETTFWGHNLL